jgi:hypothetical protein
MGEYPPGHVDAVQRVEPHFLVTARDQQPAEQFGTGGQLPGLVPVDRPDGTVVKHDLASLLSLAGHVACSTWYARQQVLEEHQAHRHRHRSLAELARSSIHNCGAMATSASNWSHRCGPTSLVSSSLMGDPGGRTRCPAPAATRWSS